MIPHNAPHELKALDNWIPLDGKGPAGDKRWSRVENRWSYDDLTVAIRQGMTCTGIAYCFQESDPFIVIDLDNPEKLEPANRDAARKLHDEILATFAGAYIERSQSGLGYHIVMRGCLPQAASRVTKGKDQCGVEIYGWGQYAHITGDVINAGYDLDGHQDGLNDLVEYLWRKFGMNNLRVPAGDLPVLDDGVRNPNLTEAETVALLRSRSRQISEMYDGGEGFSKDWSKGTSIIIGELDKIHGDPEMIWRVLFSSPRLKNAGWSKPSKTHPNGEDRFARTERRFAVELTNCRADPYQIAFIERRKALPKFDPTYVLPPQPTKQQQRESAKEALKQAMEALAKGESK